MVSRDLRLVAKKISIFLYSRRIRRCQIMSYDYSENILVQESAGNLLRDDLGWDVQFAYNTDVL